MFDILISTPNYEVCSYLLFYDHITTLMLPYICPLLIDYTTDADTMFMQEFVQRGGCCQDQFDLHVPSCAQTNIRVFMIKESRDAWGKVDVGSCEVSEVVICSTLQLFADLFDTFS